MWPIVTGSFFTGYPQVFYVKKTIAYCLSFGPGEGCKPLSSVHQLWQQLRGWRWGLLVWDKLIEHLVRVVHNHRSAFLARSLFVRSLLILCVVAQKAFSAVTSGSLLRWSLFGSNSPWQGKATRHLPAHGLESWRWNLLLRDNQGSSWWPHTNDFTDNHAPISLKKALLKLPMVQKSQGQPPLGMFSKPCFYHGISTANLNRWIPDFWLPSTPDPSLEGCSAWPRRQQKQRFLEWMEIGCLGWGLELL